MKLKTDAFESFPALEIQKVARLSLYDSMLFRGHQFTLLLVPRAFLNARSKHLSPENQKHFDSSYVDSNIPFAMIAAALPAYAMMDDADRLF